VWRVSLTLLVALRVGLELVGLASLNLSPPTELNGRWNELVGANGEPPWLALWQRWDALWYQKIATDWYALGDDTIHFEPLYPLLARIVAFVTGGSMVLAQLVVASLAFVVAAYLLQRLAAREVGEEPARLALLLTALFPAGFFLLAPYTESLFLALTLGAFW
jgi:hypothetical protein